jgi:benzoate membrane transport protein
MSTPSIRQLGRGKPFAGKDIAPACKIRQDAQAAAVAAPSSSIAGKTS